MPRPRFRPLTVKNLARTMVSILAMSRDYRQMIAAEMGDHTSLGDLLAANLKRQRTDIDQGPTPDNLGEIFDAVLNFPNDQRDSFAKQLDGLLDDLLQQDAFGTEGQCDPRGDHRDDLKYDR